MTSIAERPAPVAGLQSFMRLRDLRHRSESGYDAYLNTSFFPLIHRLTLHLGVGRFNAMGRCDVIVGIRDATADCFEAASQGDELDLLRGDAELSALVSDQVMQQFFALYGVQRAQKAVLSLPRELDASQTPS